MPEPDFWVNDRTGEVHTHDCPRVKVIHSKSPWNPAKAQLTPGVRADQACLPAGLPLRKPPVINLCSQCGEQEACMVKVGTDDGWCVTCLDQAADGVAVRLVVERARQWERGNWLVPAEAKVAGVLWGLAHDIDCGCEDSTVEHLAIYRAGRVDD